MKNFLKNLLLFFCINLISNVNNLYSMAKSPIPPRKEIWQFTDPLSQNINIDGKIGSCISTTKEEITNIYNKLTDLLKKNPKLFIILLNYTTCNIKPESNTSQQLYQLGLLSCTGKKIAVVTAIVTLMVRLEKGSTRIRSLEEIKEFLQKIL